LPALKPSSASQSRAAASRAEKIVGIQQPTLQSAFVKGDKLSCEPSRPQIVDELQQGGDGTVPRISATPLELGNQPAAVYFVEIHGSLQNNQYILDNLRAQIH
jgi:hypothetical protein